MVTSLCACSETASAVWIVPAVRCPGGNPVTALPGLTPTLSLLMVGPGLVTVEPASTANACAVPRIEVVWTTDAGGFLELAEGRAPDPQAVAARKKQERTAKEDEQSDCDGRIDRTIWRLAFRDAPGRLREKKS